MGVFTVGMVFLFLYLAYLQSIIMSNNLPTSIIDPTLAGQRRQYFLTKKKAVLDGLIGYKAELDHLTISVPVFLELLHFLTEERRRYSGLRVYFASHLWSEEDPCSRYIPSGQEENLTLIFVPTTEIAQNGNTMQRDDLDNCFIIAHNRLIRLLNPGEVAPGLDTASNWVKHYQKKIPALSLDGARVTGNGAFRETNSHWYKIAIFLDGTDTPGLISYIDKLRNDPVDPLLAIVPQFACYTPTDTAEVQMGTSATISVPLQYQLTLLFELQQKNDPVPNPVFFGFGMKHHLDDLARAAAEGGPAVKGEEVDGDIAVAPAAVAQKAVAAAPLAAGQAQPEDSDTGFPCPPYICNGSNLPAS